MEARRVTLFRNGRNQAVRIPKELELPGTVALIRKEGDRLIIEPARTSGLLEWLRALPPSEESIGPIDDPPPEDVTL